MRISRPYAFLLVVYVLFMVGIAASANLGIALWVFDVAERIPHGDKLGHLVLAGLLSYLLNRAVHCRLVSVARVRFRMGSLVAYALVLTEEISQFWVASRNMDPFDLLLDFIGICLFGMLAAKTHRRAEERTRGTAEQQRRGN